MNVYYKSRLGLACLDNVPLDLLLINVTCQVIPSYVPMAQHQRVAHIVVLVFVTTLTLRNFNFLPRRTGKKLYANFKRVAYHEWIRTIDCTKRVTKFWHDITTEFLLFPWQSRFRGKFFKQIFIFKEIEFGGRRVNAEFQRGFSF